MGWTVAQMKWLARSMERESIHNRCHCYYHGSLLTQHHRSFHQPLLPTLFAMISEARVILHLCFCDGARNGDVPKLFLPITLVIDYYCRSCTAAANLARAHDPGLLHASYWWDQSRWCDSNVDGRLLLRSKTCGARLILASASVKILLVDYQLDRQRSPAYLSKKCQWLARLSWIGEEGSLLGWRVVRRA